MIITYDSIMTAAWRLFDRTNGLDNLLSPDEQLVCLSRPERVNLSPVALMGLKRASQGVCSYSKNDRYYFSCGQKNSSKTTPRRL